MKNLIILFVLIVMPLSLYSEEGFWSVLPSTTLKNSENRPVQLDKWYNNGNFIYKDAICAIGEGGSGSFISKKGLILTNYHLIRKYIVEKDSLGIFSKWRKIEVVKWAEDAIYAPIQTVDDKNHSLR